MSCEIIQFSAAAKRSATIKTSTRVGEDIGDNIPAEIDFRSPEWKARKAERAADRPVTAINSDLRQARRKAWGAAEAATRYWSVRIEFEDAVYWAQREGLPEGRSHPDVDRADRYPMVEKYREALVRQLLTPAWDANSVKWKKATFAKGQHKHTDIKPDRIKRAIAADEAWLAEHPTRKSRPMSNERKEARRNFKEAMRRRIREIAVTLKLSDEEIRPALGLRREAIGEFVQAHGLSFGWLLEGKGSAFK
jgi:hypothetical protein